MSNSDFIAEFDKIDISQFNTIVIKADGVLFDTQNSRNQAIKDTYRYFTGKLLSDSDYEYAKNLGTKENDWALCRHLISEYGFNFSLYDITNYYQNLYWNDSLGLINNEIPVLNESLLNRLSSQYNVCVLSVYPYNELLYRLKEHNIEKYFAKVLAPISLKLDTSTKSALEMCSDICENTQILYLCNNLHDTKSAYSLGINTLCVLPNNTTSETDTEKQILLNNGALSIVQRIDSFFEKILL